MQALTLWLRSRDFDARRELVVRAIERVLADNPFTTLQVVLQPMGDPRCLSATVLDSCARAFFRRPTYLDRFFAVQPGPPKGAKRLVVVAALEMRKVVGAEWIDLIAEFGTLVWRGPSMVQNDELESHEYAIAAGSIDSDQFR
jgi:hypothetical protein